MGSQGDKTRMERTIAGLSHFISCGLILSIARPYKPTSLRTCLSLYLCWKVTRSWARQVSQAAPSVGGEEVQGVLEGG